MAGASQGNGVGTTLFLRDNHIGAAGAAAFADALRVNGALTNFATRIMRIVRNSNEDQLALAVAQWVRASTSSRRACEALFG